MNLRIIECRAGYDVQIKRRLFWWTWWESYYQGEYSSYYYFTLEQAERAFEEAKQCELRKRRRKIHKQESF